MANESDISTLGKAVRKKRLALRLSQEALAAAALGNPTRKGYISLLENGRLPGLRPETVRRIAQALDMPVNEIPHALRWPVLVDDVADGTLDGTTDKLQKLEPVIALLESLDQGMQDRLTRRPIQTYAMSLQKWLTRLTRVYGSAFSQRSFLMSLTLAYCYVFVAGVAAYGADGGEIGTLRIFSRPDQLASLSNPILALASLCVMCASAVLSYLWVRPGPLDVPLGRVRRIEAVWCVFGVRVLSAGALLGASAVIATFLGMHAIAASMIAAVSGLSALSSLGAKKAAIAGAIAGALAGSLESLMAHQNISGAIEGGIFGLLVGASSSCLAGLIAWREPTRLIGGISGAGAGASFGALISLCIFWGLEAASANEFGVSIKLLGTQDTSFIILAVTWFVLPVINAAQDFLSYGISHRLARYALDKSTELNRLILLAVLDLAAAILLAVLTFLSLTFGLWLVSQIFQFDFSPQQFVQKFWQEPYGEGIWMTIMILSTLSWTVLHYIFVLLPAIAAYAASGSVFRYSRARVARETTMKNLQLNTFLISFAPNVLYRSIYLALLLISAVLVATFAP